MVTKLIWAAAAVGLGLGALVACSDDGGGGGTSSGGGGSSSGGSGGGTSGGGTAGGGRTAGGGGAPRGGGGGGGSGITLAAADKPAVTPCPGQALLTGGAAWGTLQTALKTGTLSYLDVPYNASDADILKKKCGLDSYWNPTDNVDSIPVTGTPTIANVLITGNGGICSQGFQSFGQDDGFPVVGTYRKELKAASGGKTYHVRARISASGSAAGKKFKDLGLTTSSVKTALTYKVNGTATTHDDVWPALLDAMSAPAPAATLDVAQAGASVFTAKVELICASES